MESHRGNGAAGSIPTRGPGECESGISKTFADFEVDFQASRDQEAWTAEKHLRLKILGGGDPSSVADFVRDEEATKQQLIILWGANSVPC